MSSKPGIISVKLDSEQGSKICKALAAEQRVTLLNLLTKRAMNVNEIAAALGLSQPTASVHIRVLEEAGLIECEYSSTGRGSEKRCWATFEQLVFEADSELIQSDEFVEEVAMPIGLYTSVSVIPTCGLASNTRIIGFLDNPQSFLMPDRADAQILWFAKGWVEYTFPQNLPPTAEVTGIELVAEVCSEAPNYDNTWPSDITVWMNGVEIGTWTCPGDFGGRRGRLNPDWWSDSLTQFGASKSWSVNESGSWIDGTTAGSAKLSDLSLSYQQPITVRIGNKTESVFAGGMNLFGKHFGNYPQDLILRVRYKLKTPGQVNTVVADLLEKSTT
jgi:predicted transcriptional regulator